MNKTVYEQIDTIDTLPKRSIKSARVSDTFTAIFSWSNKIKMST